MAPSAQSHNRSHSLLLLQKLLNLRDNASPLTLILDSLEQSAAPLLREFSGRATVSLGLFFFPTFSHPTCLVNLFLNPILANIVELTHPICTDAAAYVYLLDRSLQSCIRIFCHRQETS